MSHRPAKYALRRRQAPDVFEAFRELVYLHGVDKLAPLMGLRPGTLYNKADASDDSHNQPNLRDVLLATQISGDMRVLDALNLTFGRAAYDVTQHEDTSDEDLLALLADLGRETGEFHGALAAGLRERRFTRQRLAVIHREGMDIVSALMVLLIRMEAYVDDDAQA